MDNQNECSVINSSVYYRMKEITLMKFEAFSLKVQREAKNG